MGNVVSQVIFWITRYNLTSNQSRTIRVVENQSHKPVQPPQHLTINDLHHLLNILNPVAYKCSALGLQLGLCHSTVLNIEHNYRMCNDQLRQIIAERLNKEPLTWPDLVRALRTESVKENRLASHIENRYLILQSSSALETEARYTESSSIHTQSPAAYFNQLQSSIHTSPINCFIDHVKTIYREIRKGTSVVTWPHTPTIFELTYIDVRSNGYIDLSEIANTREGDTRRLILVEGAPGVGKSTFALEFCRRWERGDIAQQYQLVLLLRLRDEKISNAKTLNDLIYHPSEHVRQAVCNEIEKSSDFPVLFILEGFDELPDNCQKETSFFMDLITGKLLPSATVLVTSQPWAAEKNICQSYEHCIYQHIEILGFTEGQITEYMKGILPHDMVSGLVVYLEKNPPIKATMNIPLNSAIVVTVYQESQAHGYGMPTTLTELYTYVTKILLLRYLHHTPDYKVGNKCLQTFQDLPPSVYAKFTQLCKIAYSGILSTAPRIQLIFRDLPSGFDNLGFMDSVTKGAVSSWSFLHVTFQEFFAALHISRMTLSQQLAHFKRHEESKLNVVLRFLAGINKLKCFSKNNCMYKVPSRQDNRFLMACDATVGITHAQWLFEAQSDAKIKVWLGKNVIEFLPSWEKMLLSDYYTLGYIISHSQCQWVLDLEERELEKMVRMVAAGASTKSNPTGRVVKFKSREIEKGTMTLSLSAEHLNMLFSKWKSILFLHHLSVKLPVQCSDITWPNLSALRVLEIIVSGQTIIWRLKYLLRHLSLESLIISPAIYTDCLTCEDCVAIGDHIMFDTSLKELCIYSNMNCEKGVESITAALAGNQSLPLEKLELECDCVYTDTAVDSLAQFVTTTTTLQHLSLENGTFGAHALLVLANASNTILQTNVASLHLKVNGDNEANDFAQLLTEYHDIVSSILYFEITKIGNVGAEAIAQALHQNSTLTELDMGNNSIGDAGAVALAQMLHSNSTLQTLYLFKNNISDAGAEALARALCQNSTMKELHLSNNSINDAGAEALGQALRQNSTMEGLYLSNNRINDAGAVALAQALHHNCTLTKLTLYGNDGIGEEGTHQLADALTVNTPVSWYCTLSLPRRCEKYVMQHAQYHAVLKNRIKFC